ncbi:MAG: SAM-dependent methyltransferase [Wenzhouxiangellaceae bacterium]|nr:SAM-dependent methyltransferase [Wenzhouxiangellaceae bacterium]
MRPGTSRRVRTTQREPHPRLEEIVRRHCQNRWRQPLHPSSAGAFERVLDWYCPDRPLLLDSGCGTGGSCLRLAERYPDSQVLGIDQSDHRLGRGLEQVPNSVLLLRARAEDIWRLLLDAGICPARHFLLYPNPWPKPAQLQRRWHGHPVFPDLLRLGALELRCNWRVYAEEFARAARLAGASTSAVVSFLPEYPISPFEAKYAASGHTLFQLHCQHFDSGEC